MRHTSFPSLWVRRVAAGLLLFVVLACCVIGRPAPACADGLDLARERWQTCQELYKKGDPCAALRACEEGLAARATRSLEELSTAARAACDHTSRPPTTKPSRDPDRDGASGDQDLCPTTAEDFDGFQDTDGCPDPDNDNDTLTDLLDQCPLSAEDIDNFQDADGCPDPDNDNDTLLDVRDQCPNDPEDLDSFQDTDGCPDPDNDNDTLTDTLDQCPLSAEDPDEFQDSDGCPDPDNDTDSLADTLDQCPLSAEDLDSFQDADGCPDPDNDTDSILDALDQCPNNPEDFDQDQDSDGCPDDNISAVAITGWSLLGAGVVSAGLGIGLHVSAESKRDQVREPTIENDNNFRGVITSITMREAQTLADDADTLDTVALITATAGGALVLGGVTLLLLDLFDTADGSPPISLCPSVHAEGASLFLLGRF